MPRPRKLKDVGELREDAYLLALSFYMLRDGAPGLLAHRRSGVWRTKRVPEFDAEKILGFGPEGPIWVHGQPEKIRYTLIRYRVTTLVVPATREARRDVLGLMKRNKNWSFRPPAYRRPEIWKRLIKARTVAAVQEVARRIRRQQSWVLASILYSHAEGFLRAKRLHNYPESNRPGSDDKRIQFFAKVLAGLKLGIAPATATKRLAHSGLPDRHTYSGLFSSMPIYSELFKVRQKGEKK